MLKMKMGKAAESKGVPIEVIRICGLESALTRIGNSMVYREECRKVGEGVF